MGVISVEARGDATVELEFAKTPFDEIALRVELFVMAVLMFAGALGWNDRLHSVGSDERSNLIGVIAFVGNHRLGRLPGQQRRGALAISFLSCGQQQAQRSAQSIAKHVDLGGQSSTGSPQSLLTRPLFPVAAC